MSSVYRPHGAFDQSFSASQCAASVHDSGRGVGFHQCQRKGTLEHDGHKWCKQHFPPNVEKKHAEWEAKYRAERAAEDEAWRKKKVAARFEDILRQIAAGHNDPRSLAQAILDEYDGEAGQ